MKYMIEGFLEMCGTVLVGVVIALFGAALIGALVVVLTETWLHIFSYF